MVWKGKFPYFIPAHSFHAMLAIVHTIFDTFCILSQFAQYLRYCSIFATRMWNFSAVYILIIQNDASIPFPMIVSQNTVLHCYNHQGCCGSGSNMCNSHAHAWVILNIFTSQHQRYPSFNQSEPHLITLQCGLDTDTVRRNMAPGSEIFVHDIYIEIDIVLCDCKSHTEKPSFQTVQTMLDRLTENPSASGPILERYREQSEYACLVLARRRPARRRIGRR